MITFEIYGIGFELSLGEIDKSKFEYWKDKEISEEDMNEDNEFRFLENGKLKRKETLIFIHLIAVVIQNGMNILGVSLPKKM